MNKQRRTQFQSKRNLQHNVYEQFEPRMLLSATGELSSIQQQQLLDHISANPDTAYLQFGSSNLEFAAAEQNDGETTALFQQTINKIPVRNTYISVVQNTDGEIDVFDRGHVNLRLNESVPSVGSFAASHIANEFRSDAATSSELVWFADGDQGRLAWEVFSFVGDEVIGDPSDADFYTIVDAHTGDVLEQDTPGTVVEDLLSVPETMVGVHPRIVINNAIGAAGSRAYAAPFDAVVRLGGCTGTLIDSNTVLTARHCGITPGTQVRFGDNSNAPVLTRTVANVSNPGGGNSNSPLLNGGDVAIANLTASVPTNIATPMRLIAETSSLVGEVGGLHGYGFNGLGSNGHGFSADGFRWGGENIIDRYGSPSGAGGTNIFSTDFDNGSSSNNTIPGSSPTPIQFEATTAPGDSGGPLLVEVGGEWLIAGVLSGGTTNTSVYGDISWWTGIANFQSQIEAAGGEFANGEFEGEVGPDNLNIIRGQQTSGNLAALASSNNIDLELDQDVKLSDTLPPIQFEVSATLPLDDPSQLEFRVEASTNTGNVIQLVEVYNFVLDQYQLLGFDEVSVFADGTVNIPLSPSTQYVEAGSADVSARITYLANGPVFFNTWSVDIDQAAWIVNGGATPPDLGPGDGDSDGGRSFNDRFNLSDLVATTPMTKGTERAVIAAPTMIQTGETPVRPLMEERSLIDRKPLTDRLFDIAHADLDDMIDEFDLEEIEIDVAQTDWLAKTRK